MSSNQDGLTRVTFSNPPNRLINAFFQFISTFATELFIVVGNRQKEALIRMEVLGLSLEFTEVQLF